MDEKGFRTIDDFRGLSRPEGHRVEASRPELQDRRAHQSRHLHRLRSLLHRLLGWRAPVHPSGSTHARRVEPASRSHRSTPVTKLESPTCHRTARRRPPASRASMKRNASAAISAGWSARWKTASRWRESKPAAPQKAGRKGQVRESYRLEQTGKPMSTLIRNGTVVTATHTVPADILIDGEKIKEVRAGIPENSGRHGHRRHRHATCCPAASTATPISTCRSAAPRSPTISKPAPAPRPSAAPPPSSISPSSPAAPTCAMRSTPGGRRPRARPASITACT